MKRKQRRALAWVGALALVLVALLGVLWWLREPLLQLVPPPPIVITEKDQGRIITLIRGARLEVRLPSNNRSGSTWRVSRPVPFLPETGDVTFTPARDPAAEGDGYQSNTFTATAKGMGPLALGYIANNDQNSFQPSKSFSVVVVVK